MPDHSETRFQFTLTYNHAQLRKAVFNVFTRRKYVVWLYGLGLPFAILAFVFTPTVLMGTLTLFFIYQTILRVYGGIKVYRDFIALWKNAPTWQVEFFIFEEEIEWKFPVGSSRIPWASFSSLEQKPDCWMLFLYNKTWMLLPVENFPPEAQAFLLAKLREHNVKIS